MAWTPSLAATHVEAVFHDESPGSVLVEHFNDPFEVAIADGTDASLRQAAHVYLGELQAHADIGPRLQFPPHWMAALDPARGEHPLFGWLPFDEPQPSTHQDITGPYGSFRFAPAWDDVAMLFAADRLGPDHYLGSGFGLALATRTRDDGGTLKACFVGMCAALPYGIWARPLPVPHIGPLLAFFSLNNLFRNSAVLATMAAATTLEDMRIRGVRVAATADRRWIERRATGVRRTAGGDIPYAVTMLSVDWDGMPASDTITHMAPLVADAAGDARVFDNDPSSAAGMLVRPTRDDLDTFRVVEKILPGNQGALEFPAGSAKPLVQVVRCPRFVRADASATTPGDARHVNLGPGAPPVLSDDASAIQAFRHARELVQRLSAYGWTNPASYFRITAPEIKIFYRSGVSPGPGKDGRTVNARVIPESWPVDAIGWAGTSRPAVQIHLASAELRVRDRQPWVPGGPATPARSLGIAADKRWMWHEFGHVLLVASTGELEFRFAHSPGDAMAAIASDPESKLPGNLRGLTFPFVFLPRQHDRCAQHGWSWSGTFHQELASVPDAQHPRPKGYASEQILSSSLFRLYRCIGGDTGQASAPNTPDAYVRRRASHYTLYLIMQAMQMMGDARIQATSTPAKFVHWLKQADRQKGKWTATWGPDQFARVGGTLWKVIRWAFEAQGLHGSGNGPGSPEKVDIYIADGRPARDQDLYGDADFGPGNYVPVSLHWQSANAAAPAWQAHPVTGITFPNANGEVEVRVGNRGPRPANNVAVTLWFAAWPPNSNAPDWSTAGAAWTQCAATGPATQNIAGNTAPGPSGFTFIFPPAPAPAAGRYILLAQASCLDDRANTDPALLLACSVVPTPLPDLVANDNNLALLVVSI